MGVHYSEEEYHKAYLIWKEENPEKENVPYNAVVELPNMKVSLGKRITIMKSMLKECLFKYVRVIREYQIMDVGLEENVEEKIKKISEYNLTDEDIEESYFVPFRFEGGKLLEQDSEQSRRRDLIRQYIIDLDFYTEEEIKSEHNFTEEEISLMRKTREKIDKTINKVKQMKG